MDSNIVFTIVTPCCNSDKFINETIESVISQSGDFSIEYIIVDNCSTDSTLEKIYKYQNDLQSKHRPINCNDVKIILISEKDSGMYDAINKGFLSATGDLCAWLNSDDIYMNGCLNLMKDIFTKFSDIMWVKGITSYINSKSTIYRCGRNNLYSREWISAGFYGPALPFIQQDSVFWRRDLLDQAGGVNPAFNLAGDYDLWRRFSKYSALYSVDAYVSCFRKVDNQKSENLEDYWQEIVGIDAITASGNEIKVSISEYEKRKKKLFRKNNQSAYSHEFHLITVSCDGLLTRFDGEYEELIQLI